VVPRFHVAGAVTSSSARHPRRSITASPYGKPALRAVRRSCSGCSSRQRGGPSEPVRGHPHRCVAGRGHRAAAVGALRATRGHALRCADDAGEASRALVTPCVCCACRCCVTGSHRVVVVIFVVFEVAGVRCSPLCCAPLRAVMRCRVLSCARVGVSRP
jgi:hypothetical protein